MKQKSILMAITKRFSVHRLVRLGITVAVLACLLFPSVAVKLVYAKPADLAQDVPTQFPCNFDGVISGVGDMLPTGNPDVHDYNLTDNWGGTWCDAEKTGADTDDDLMCWAAAASNVLEWTGWGFVNHSIEGEMTNCDQIFEHFNDHWEDQGSLTNIGWMWWFNGVAGLPGDYPNDPPYNGGPASWSEVDVPGGGDFWDPPYVLSDYYHSYSGAETLQHIDEYLRAGYGVALGIYNGGHAITCWGFRYDDAYDPATEPENHYLGLYITDSDNYDATDTIRYFTVSYNAGISRWEFDTYGGGGWHIEHVFALEKNTFLEPDLAIYKTAYPNVVMAGEELFYNITVVNENTIVGGVTAYNVVVTDTLPIGVTYIADTGGGTQINPSLYSYSLGDIIPGGSRSFTIKLRVNLDYVPLGNGFTITNTATVTSDSQLWESDLTNNVATVTSFVQNDVADLWLTKSGPSSITTCILTQEPTFLYTLTVTNNGPATAVNVLVEDWLPAGVRINSVTSSKGSCNAGVPGDAFRPTTCAIDSLAMGASATVTINVTVLKPADLSMESWILHNDARVSSDLLDLDNSNNLASWKTTIINTCIQEPADLKVIKLVKPDTTVLAGQLINYTIIVENLGPSIAYNVSIRDEILSSGNFILVGFHLDPDRNDVGPFYPTSPAGGLTLEFILTEPLEPKNITGGGRWVLQITLRANETQDINDVVNVFTRTLRTLDPELSNNEAESSIHVTAVADLELTKTDNPDPVVTQQSCALTYTLVVTNHGPSTAVNVFVEDLLPAGVSIKNISVTIGSFNAGVPGDPSRPTIWAIGSLASGASGTMTIKVTIPQNIEPHIKRNDARVSSDTLDIDNSNNMASQDTKVVHYIGQLPILAKVLDPVDNQYLSLAAIGLISLASLISSIAAISIFKRRTVRQFIGFLKAKKE